MPDINLIKGVITRAAISHFPISVLILLTAGQLFPPPLKEEMGETRFNLTHALSTRGHPKTSFFDNMPQTTKSYLLHTTNLRKMFLCFMCLENQLIC